MLERLPAELLIAVFARLGERPDNAFRACRATWRLGQDTRAMLLWLQATFGRSSAVLMLTSLRVVVRWDEARVYSAVCQLLQGGCVVGDATQTGCVLYWATKRGMARVLDLLLVHLAQEGNQVGLLTWLNSLLKTACAQGHEQCVRVLLNKGADPNVDTGRPLKAATEVGAVGCVCALLDASADLHAGTECALRMCAAAGSPAHVEVMALLLQRGADVHAKGDEALSLAVERSNAEAVALLLHHGANASARQVLETAAATGCARVVRLLLAHGAEPDADGGRPLRAAAQAGAVEVVHQLLDAGARCGNGGVAHAHAHQPPSGGSGGGLVGGVIKMGGSRRRLLGQRPSAGLAGMAAAAAGGRPSQRLAQGVARLQLQQRQDRAPAPGATAAAPQLPEPVQDTPGSTPLQLQEEQVGEAEGPCQARPAAKPTTSSDTTAASCCSTGTAASAAAAASSWRRGWGGAQPAVGPAAAHAPRLSPPQEEGEEVEQPCRPPPPALLPANAGSLLRSVSSLQSDDFMDGVGWNSESSDPSEAFDEDDDASMEEDGNEVAATGSFFPELLRMDEGGGEGPEEDVVGSGLEAGSAALCAALCAGEAEVARVLLERGARMDVAALRCWRHWHRYPGVMAVLQQHRPLGPNPCCVLPAPPQQQPVGGARHAPVPPPHGTSSADGGWGALPAPGPGSLATPAPPSTVEHLRSTAGGHGGSRGASSRPTAAGFGSTMYQDGHAMQQFFASATLRGGDLVDVTDGGGFGAGGAAMGPRAVAAAVAAALPQYGLRKSGSGWCLSSPLPPTPLLALPMPPTILPSQPLCSSSGGTRHSSSNGLPAAGPSTLLADTHARMVAALAPFGACSGGGSGGSYRACVHFGAHGGTCHDSAVAGQARLVGAQLTGWAGGGTGEGGGGGGGLLFSSPPPPALPQQYSGWSSAALQQQLRESLVAAAGEGSEAAVRLFLTWGAPPPPPLAGLSTATAASPAADAMAPSATSNTTLSINKVSLGGKPAPCAVGSGASPLASGYEALEGVAVSLHALAINASSSPHALGSGTGSGAPRTLGCESAPAAQQEQGHMALAGTGGMAAPTQARKRDSDGAKAPSSLSQPGSGGTGGSSALGGAQKRARHNQRWPRCAASGVALEESLGAFTPQCLATALTAAAASNRPVIASQILQHKPSVAWAHAALSVPAALHAAVTEGHLEVARLLLQAGAGACTLQPQRLLLETQRAVVVTSGGYVAAAGVPLLGAGVPPPPPPLQGEMWGTVVLCAAAACKAGSRVASAATLLLLQHGFGACARDALRLVACGRVPTWREDPTMAVLAAAFSSAAADADAPPAGL